MVTTCFVAVTTAKTLWARWRHTVFILSNGSSCSLQWQILSSSFLWCILVTIQKRQTISATCMRSTDRVWYPEANPKSCWSQRRLGQTRIQELSQLSWRLLQSWLRGDSFLPPLHQGGAGIAQSLRILSILYCLLLPLLLFGRGCKGEPVGAKSLKIPSLHLFKYQRQIAFGPMSKELRNHFITCYTTEIVFAIFEKNLELKTILAPTRENQSPTGGLE